jgi:hypothetical protein
VDAADEGRMHAIASPGVHMCTRMMCAGDGRCAMRATIMIRRQRAEPETTGGTSPEPKLVGTDATDALATISGISAISIETQYGDRALLSYESSEARQNFDLVDAVLQSNGMCRLQ